ncbi:hypothetical protein HNY73_000702 [Argiope bruennichi]|uniref:Uncharacterized protein n=1 Tax=Argiope bruennichi TaxID=94029 RepID=A0A8T0G1D5_ARGBR|nr:hypothetical protein HNY73_000702 [Argiope bruennichi]
MSANLEWLPAKKLVIPTFGAVVQRICFAKLTVKVCHPWQLDIEEYICLGPLWFRKHSIVSTISTADIKRMYRQIWMHPISVIYNVFLWKDLEEEKLRVFKLLTVTYGTKCAPYLATRVLKQICCDEQNNYPLAAAAGKDFYVDDILSGPRIYLLH